MEKHSKNSIIEEVKKEFQLERMILFSDAVFAIVITLMAIEIRLPHSSGEHDEEQFMHQLKALTPTIVAYLVSFFFIGMSWSRHLRVFGHLKSFDGGLIFRNLLMLFFFGLFPFSVSLISGMQGFAAYVVYFIIALMCNWTQIFLFHYILISKPELRNDSPVYESVLRLQTNKVVTTVLTVCAGISIYTMTLIDDPMKKSMAFMWLGFAGIAARLMKRRNKRLLASHQEG